METELTRESRWPRPSTLAIGGLALGIYAYDYFCPPGEQISERCDEWVSHPIKRRLLEAGAAAIALHLTNRINPKVDLLHYMIPEKKR